MSRLVTFNFIVQEELEPDEDGSVEAAILEAWQHLQLYGVEVIARVYDEKVWDRFPASEDEMTVDEAIKGADDA